jgi:hypothetical protein
MFSKRSAVKPSQCEDVTKKPKNKRGSTLNFITEVKSLYYATVKKLSMQEHYRNFQSGL